MTASYQPRRQEGLPERARRQHRKRKDTKKRWRWRTKTKDTRESSVFRNKGGQREAACEVREDCGRNVNWPCGSREARDVRGTVQNPGLKQGLHDTREGDHGPETASGACDGYHWNLDTHTHTHTHTHTQRESQNVKKMEMCLFTQLHKYSVGSLTFTLRPFSLQIFSCSTTLSVPHGFLPLPLGLISWSVQNILTEMIPGHEVKEYCSTAESGFCLSHRSGVSCINWSYKKKKKKAWLYITAGSEAKNRPGRKWNLDWA